MEIPNYFNEYYYNLLKNIRINPTKYLRRPALKYLKYFLFGYDHALYHNANKVRVINKETRLYNISDIREILQKKYKTSNTNYSFDIIDYYSSCEEEAFDEIFNIIDNNVQIVTNTKYTNPYKSLSKAHAKFMENSAKKQEIYEQRLSLNERYYCSLSTIRYYAILYMGIKSLKYLEAFINGYHTCVDIYQTSFNPHPNFDKFIRDKYSVVNEKNMFDIIEFNNIESKTFDIYFEHLCEYLEINNATKYKEILNTNALSELRYRQTKMSTLVDRLDCNLPKSVQKCAINELVSMAHESDCSLIHSFDENKWANIIHVINKIGYPKNSIALPSVLSILTHEKCPDIQQTMTILKEADKNELILHIEIEIESNINSKSKSSNEIWRNRLKRFLVFADIDKKDFLDGKMYDFLME